MLGQFKISYTNKRNRSGYKLVQRLDKVGILLEGWIVPKHADAPAEDVIFDEKVFEEFFKLFDYYKDKDMQATEILRFYNKYGPLQGFQRERLKDTIGLIDLLRVDDSKRKNLKNPGLRYTLPLGEFEHWEDGKVLLTFKPKSLSEAIFTAWTFNWDSVDLTKCKYLEEFGLRKKCKKFFQGERTTKLFCSDECRKAYSYKKKGTL